MANRHALNVNGTDHEVDADPETPLLYVLRNDLQLKGTRFGCGAGECGACNVLIDGHCVQACNTPLWATAGKRVTTIEGLGGANGWHFLQQAFIREQAAQCGYCVSGVIISASALLDRNPDPGEDEIRAALDRNLCRCGTYGRFVRAIRRAAAERKKGGTP